MAKGPLTVLAYSQDDTIKLDEGKLALVDNEILQTTGTIRLKAEFPNTAHRLWPGELINVRLLLETRHDGLTVPASAVQQGQQGALRYVINADDTVQVRPVTVAQISGGQALIDSGLDGKRAGRRRWAVQAAGRQPRDASCTARRPRRQRRRARSRRRSHEHLGALHSRVRSRRLC